MRILIATYLSYPVQGGQSTYITTLKNILEEHGHSVHIFARHPTKRMFYLVGKEPLHEQRLLNKRIRKVVKRQLQSSLTSLSKWIMNEELEQTFFQLCIERLNLQLYDLIHAQDVVSTLVISRIERGNIPLVTTIHGLYSHELIADQQFEGEYCLEKEYVFNRDCKGLAASDRVIVPSHYLKKRLIHEFYLDEKKAVVVANGLDVQLFYPEQKALARFTIACSARLTKRKGHFVLLDALARLIKETANFQCFIIGDGPLKLELKKYCAHKRLTKHVQFLGYRTDVKELLKGCDVLVLPTLNDNFPYTVMEGMAAGKVVIASEVGGIPEMIVNDKTGLLFPAGDAELLAKKLKTIIQDERFKKTIKENAFDYAREWWDSSAFYNRIINAYEQLDEID